MFDIITFGSATIDTFLKLSDKDYHISKDDKFSSGKAFCLPLGSKILIDDLKISSGGGGTNTAVFLLLVAKLDNFSDHVFHRWVSFIADFLNIGIISINS